MNKFLLLLIVPLLSFCLMGHEDDKETKPMDLSLLADTWEVVDQGNQEVFEKDCIIDVTVSTDQTDGAYGGYHGFITTYYLSADGTPPMTRSMAGAFARWKTITHCWIWSSKAILTATILGKANISIRQPS